MAVLLRSGRRASGECCSDRPAYSCSHPRRTRKKSRTRSGAISNPNTNRGVKSYRCSLEKVEAAYTPSNSAPIAVVPSPSNSGRYPGSKSCRTIDVDSRSARADNHAKNRDSPKSTVLASTPRHAQDEPWPGTVPPRERAGRRFRRRRGGAGQRSVAMHAFAPRSPPSTGKHRRWPHTSLINDDVHHQLQGPQGCADAKERSVHTIVTCLPIEAADVRVAATRQQNRERRTRGDRGARSPARLIWRLRSYHFEQAVAEPARNRANLEPHGFAEQIALDEVETAARPPRPRSARVLDPPPPQSGLCFLCRDSMMWRHTVCLSRSLAQPVTNCLSTLSSTKGRIEPDQRGELAPRLSIEQQYCEGAPPWRHRSTEWRLGITAALSILMSSPPMRMCRISGRDRAPRGDL